MRTVYVSFPTEKSVQRFVERISPLEGQFDFLSDGYVLDAKSLMGIFSLDLTRPLMLRIEKDTSEAIHAIKSFMMEDLPACTGVPGRRQTVLEDLNE